MTLRIFLDENSFHCLKKSIPPGSKSKFVSMRKPLGFTSNFVISCEEVDARNFLLYAGHCPALVASIHEALRSAGLSLEMIR